MAVSLAAAAVPFPGPASAQSRFLSYGTEAECVAGRVLSAPLCRTAFANAMQEFAARTPAFASLAQCGKAFGTCAAWPPGTSPARSFRPRWDGVEIVDTPREKSVTPAAVPGPKRIAFAPQPLTEFRSLDVRGPRRPSDRPGEAVRRPAVGRDEARGAPVGPSAPPVAGSGFKLEDGVLTFPAPSRFQPRNLPRSP